MTDCLSRWSALGKHLLRRICALNSGRGSRRGCDRGQFRRLFEFTRRSFSDDEIEFVDKFSNPSSCWGLSTQHGSSQRIFHRYVNNNSYYKSTAPRLFNTHVNFSMSHNSVAEMWDYPPQQAYRVRVARPEPTLG